MLLIRIGIKLIGETEPTALIHSLEKISKILRKCSRNGRFAVISFFISLPRKYVFLAIAYLGSLIIKFNNIWNKALIRFPLSLPL